MEFVRILIVSTEILQLLRDTEFLIKSITNMSNHDVLQTLTFLSNLTRDCDECEIPSEQSYKLPPPTKKLAFGYDAPLPHNSKMNPFNKERVSKLYKQKRSLLDRDTVTGLSMWKLILPCEATPLIELGYNHRIVYIQNLSQVS